MNDTRSANARKSDHGTCSMVHASFTIRLRLMPACFIFLDVCNVYKYMKG